METPDQTQHPYHSSITKNLSQHILDFALPLGLFLLYFFFYNFGRFTISEMIKTTGLVAISLLSITLVVGPLGKFVSWVNMIKIHRKFWGISSFVFAAIHATLSFIAYFNLNIFDLFNPSSHEFPAIMAGFISLLILFIATVTSSRKIIQHMNPHIWKTIQTTSYVALFLAVAHFFLKEQVDGVFVVKRLLGRITYWFAAGVILFRLIVALIPKKQIDPVRE